MWCKDKPQLSKARLRRQIAQCSPIINRDKTEYYSTVSNENSHDPKKLWQALRQVFNKGHEMTLPPQSDKSICFLFHSKNQEIPRCVSSSTATVAPPMDSPPNLSHFSEVSENEILKIIKNSQTKSCLF